VRYADVEQAARDLNKRGVHTQLCQRVSRNSPRVAKVQTLTVAISVDGLQPEQMHGANPGL